MIRNIVELPFKVCYRLQDFRKLLEYVRSYANTHVALSKLRLAHWFINPALTAAVIAAIVCRIGKYVAFITAAFFIRGVSPKVRRLRKLDV